MIGSLSLSLKRDLTASEHRSIRRQLMLIPVYIWAIFSWTNFFEQLASDDGRVRDFMHFYVQGVVADTRDRPALYDIDRHAEILESRVAHAKNVRYPPVYGPQVALLFAPLGRLPYPSALRIWLVITALGTALCMWALWRVTGSLHDRAWPACLFVLAAPALRFDLASGQAAVIGLACITAAYLALRSGHRFWAGVAVGALAYKPQLGLGMAFVFVLSREWRIVAGAATAVAVQLAVGTLYWGGAMLPRYLAALGRLPAVAADMEVFKDQMHSWRSFFELLGLTGAPAMIAYGMTALLTAGVALACWRSRGPLAARYAVLVLASLLVNPHLYGYDLLLALPALLLLWDWAASERARRLEDIFPALAASRAGQWPYGVSFCVLLVLCYCGPVLGEIAERTRVQPSVLLHALVIAVTAARNVPLLPAAAPALHSRCCAIDNHA